MQYRKIFAMRKLWLLCHILCVVAIHGLTHEDVYFKEQLEDAIPFNIYHDSNCTTEMSTGSSCELKCVFNAGPQQLSEWQWLYYIEDANASAVIFDDVKMASAENGTETQLTLLLTTYNAGYYRCQFHYQNRTSDYLAYADFQIDPEEKGVHLHDFCSSSGQCLTLYSTCENDTCQCQYPYVYYMDDENETVACLKGVGPFEPCNINQQCTDAGQNYNCTNNICDCSAIYEYVPEVNNYLCIYAVREGGSCQYQEECLLTDQYMWCYNNICQCADDYTFNDTMKYCVNGTSDSYVYPTDGLTFEAIVAIIIGVALFFIVMFAVVGIIMICKNRR